MRLLRIKLVNILFLILVFSACNKQETAKPVDGKISKQLSELKNRYPGIQIELAKASERELLMLSSDNQIETYADSLLQAFENQISTIEADYNIPYSSSMFGCAEGTNMTAYSGGAGIFSSFHAEFQYKNGGVSGLNFYTSGVRIGWEINSQKNLLTTPASGCTTITARFGTGVIGWDYKMHINWSLDATNCVWNYSQGSGACSGVYSDEEPYPDEPIADSSEIDLPVPTP